MATKKTKKKRTTSTECPCNHGWVCEEHPGEPWNHQGCGAAGELCKNPQCDKDPDFIFVFGEPGKRKPPVRKLCYQVGLIHSPNATVNFRYVTVGPAVGQRDSLKPDRRELT